MRLYSVDDVLCHAEPDKIPRVTPPVLLREGSQSFTINMDDC